MINNHYEVAILLATFNGERFIERQLSSIANQTYKNFTCYIHDDGSTDNTCEIIRKFIKKDKRFKYVSGPSQHGAKNNFMFLLNSVNSEYYFFSDQDDFWHKNKIELQLSGLKKIEKDKNYPSLCFCNLNVVKNDCIISNNFMKYSGFYVDKIDYKNIAFKNVAPGCAMCINKSLRNEALKVSDYTNIEMHDWWCILIASTVGKCLFLDLCLNDYYQHDGQQIGAIYDKNHIRKMIKKTFVLFSREERERKSSWINCVSKQAYEICKILGEKDSHFSEFYNLSQLKKTYKIKKIYWLIKYHWNYAGSFIWNLRWI